MIQEGDKYNRITVIRRSEAKSKDGHSRWLCRCDCGNEFFATASNIGKQTECAECAYRTRSEKAVLRRGHHRRQEIYYIPNVGKRMLDIINSKDINISAMARATGVARGAIYCLLYEGRDMSSSRLAKLCSYCEVSADYILGLKEGVANGM